MGGLFFSTSWLPVLQMSQTTQCSQISDKSSSFSCSSSHAFVWMRHCFLSKWNHTNIDESVDNNSLQLACSCWTHEWNGGRGSGQQTLIITGLIHIRRWFQFLWLRMAHFFGLSLIIRMKWSLPWKWHFWCSLLRRIGTSKIVGVPFQISLSLRSGRKNWLASKWSLQRV